jgi:hypothetical protein
MFLRAEVKTSFSSLTVSFLITLPLHKQFMQGHIAGGEYTQVAMQWKNPFVGLHGKRSTNCNGFLPNTAEPFADFTLSKENQHFFFNHPGQ